MLIDVRKLKEGKIVQPKPNPHNGEPGIRTAIDHCIDAVFDAYTAKKKPLT